MRAVISVLHYLETKVINENPHTQMGLYLQGNITPKTLVLGLGVWPQQSYNQTKY